MPDDHKPDDCERTDVFERTELLELFPPHSRAHVLVRMDGSEIGQVTTLSVRPLDLGRHPRSAVHLPYEGVSRQHARIVHRDGGYWVEDLDSANGTFVRGARVVRQKLTDGDVIQLGPRVVFRYSITDADEERVLRQLYESSVKDSLTGAYNREYFGERLESETAFARRHSVHLSLVMIDVDHFKRVNDTFGHPAGDAVLASMASLIAQTLRTEDVLARYGGEEFLVLLRGTPLPEAARVADRLRVLVAADRVSHQGQVVRCTISGGCASLACAEAPTAASLIAVADRRLYVAKRRGRDRIVSSG